jgi:ribosomal protein S18 acetylase RimI-like enzyme
MHIRTGSASDIPTVLSFWRTATTEQSATDDAPSLLGLLRHAPDALLLAVERDEIVGTAILGWDGWRGAMYRLAVAPAHRRRGIATRLVREGEKRLRERGAARIHLIVAADQEPAQAFWSIAGYERTDQDRFVKSLATP